VSLLGAEPDHADVVVHEISDDVVLFISRQTASSLAVLLHVVDDHPDATLSPHLKPLMRALDKQLIGYKGKRAV
jgi:hypothetical protein